VWSRRAAWAAVVGVCAVLAIAVLLILISVVLPRGSAASDSRRIFCLTGSQRQALASAAVTLGVARPGATPGEVSVAGHSLTLETWRQRRPGDFDRTCSALMDAARVTQPASTGVNSQLLSAATALFSAIIGAGLTWVIGESRATAERSRLQGEALSTAGVTFAQEAERYITEWMGPHGRGTPSDHLLRDYRNDLARQLSRVNRMYRGMSRAGELRDRLHTGELGDRMTASLGKARAERQAGKQDQSGPDGTAARLRILLRDFQDDVDSVADALMRASIGGRGAATHFRRPARQGGAGSGEASK
jgi:hypothetical protein